MVYTLSKIERGILNISIVNAFKISKALHIWFDAEKNIYRTKEINSAFLINPTGTRPPDDNGKGTPHPPDEKSPFVPEDFLNSNFFRDLKAVSDFKNRLKFDKLDFGVR